MKKIVKLTDGSEVTYEGTPEEIAEMEKHSGGVLKHENKKGRRLLKESHVSADDMLSEIERLLAANKAEVIEELKKQHIMHVCPTYYPWLLYPTTPYWTGPVVDPIIDPYLKPPVYTTTITSGKTDDAFSEESFITLRPETAGTFVSGEVAFNEIGVVGN